MVYVHCNTCIGVRASLNKLTTLITLQYNEIIACNVYIYISGVRYVTHNCSKYISTSHFKSSDNESPSPLIHAHLHRTCQHSEPKFHVRLWFPNASYLILTVSSYCSLSSTPPLCGSTHGVRSLQDMHWRYRT